jgi:hypothetical protein
MRKVLPVIAGALLAGAVGLFKNGPRRKKAPSPKAKRAAVTAQHRGPRLSARGHKSTHKGHLEAAGRKK